MKLINYKQKNKQGVGVVDGDHLFDLAGVSGMIDLIGKGNRGLELAKAALAANSQKIPIADIEYLPVVERPGKVIALGRNYAAHAAEGGAKPPAFPMLFHKTHTSLNGANQPVLIPDGTEQVDNEAELAVIIGRNCKNVTEDQALDYVYGYTAANDVSARDWQWKTSQFTAGKMVDGFCPLGPALVTKDEINDVQNLDIKLFLNGQIMQSSNTKMMIFSVAFTIAYISQICTLEVGDVILTGTPAGVGYARTPPVFMQAGDQVVVEIESIGQLKNHFVRN